MTNINKTATVLLSVLLIILSGSNTALSSPEQTATCPSPETSIPRVSEAFLPTPLPVPGGVAILPVLAESSNGKIKNEGPEEDTIVSAYYGDQQVMLVNTISDDSKAPGLRAVIGLPLDIGPGTHHLDLVHCNGEKTRMAFEVKNKKYKEQRLKIKNKRKVNPSKKDLDRIFAEQKRVIGAFKNWEKNSFLVTPLSLPVKGKLSSPFGLKRFFNNQPRKPHSGLDIAAPIGTPILSPTDGRIVEKGNFFFNGNTVFIDHGLGLVTMYCHMNSIEVKIGQKVKAGEKIGTVGKTGRATGPHLHWSVSLNNARVDPSLFLKSP